MTDFAKLELELQRLDMDAIIELFILHLGVKSPALSDFHFHSGLNGVSQPIVWQGQQYEAYPAQLSGFKMSGEGAAARPALTIANLTGTMTGLAGSFRDLIGVPVSRIITYRKFLDEVNFPSGNPTADPTVEFPRQTFEIGQKIGENPVQMQFSLNSVIDIEGVFIPRRQIVRNVCTWQYRGDGCFYDGPPRANEYDVIVSTYEADKCSKTLNGCRLRFGQNGILNYGSFPALSLL